MVMQQMVPALPIGWGDPGTYGPMTLIGMREHQDVTVGVRFKLPAGAPSIASGCVGTRADQMWHNAIAFCVQTSGTWTLSVGGPKLGTNTFASTMATGTVSDAASGSWHSITLTTVGASATGVFDGKQVFSNAPIRDLDTGFAVIGGSHWLEMQYDNFTYEVAAGAGLVQSRTMRSAAAAAAAPTAPAGAGTSVCNTNCSRNGVVDANQEFDILSNWNIVHKQSGNCVTESASDGSLTLAACNFGVGNGQSFLNDYTRIRAGTVPITTRNNGTLVGTLDGKVSVRPGAGGNGGGWSKWTYFPNTKQLRNQHSADLILGYPRCFAAC